MTDLPRARPAEGDRGRWVLAASAGLVSALVLGSLVLEPGAAVLRMDVGPVEASGTGLPGEVPASAPAGDSPPGSRDPAALAAEAERTARAVALASADLLLARRQEALAAGDPGSWVGTVTDALTTEAAADFDALSTLPLSEFTLALDESTFERDGSAGGWRGRVFSTYRLGEAPAIRRTDGFLLVSSSEGMRFADWETDPYPYAGDVGTAAPWHLGPVEHVVGDRAVVLVWPDQGQDPSVAEGEALALASSVSGWADTGSGIVDRFHGESWPRDSLVLVPSSAEQFTALVPGSGLDDGGALYAAVTVDTDGPDGVRDVVVLNPAAREDLVEETWQVTVTHELAHVASGARFGDDQPLWLSEGLADLIAWSDLVRGPEQRELVAARLLERVRGGQGPGGLPGDEDFSSGDADVVGDAYDGSWLAALVLQDRLGTDGLLGVYSATSTGEGTSAERLDAALSSQLGVDAAGFEQQWLQQLADLAGDPPA